MLVRTYSRPTLVYPLFSNGPKLIAQYNQSRFMYLEINLVSSDMEKIEKKWIGGVIVFYKH